MDGEAKCNCQRCGQPIAFPLDLNNTDVECPHCGKQTTVAIPRVRPVTTYPNFAAAPAAAPANNISTLVGCGYIFAIIMPLVGFILGIILCAKNRVGSGLACMALSLLFFFIWGLVLNSVLS